MVFVIFQPVDAPTSVVPNPAKSNQLTGQPSGNAVGRTKSIERDASLVFSRHKLRGCTLHALHVTSINKEVDIASFAEGSFI
jgi:hypothetical protein